VASKTTDRIPIGRARRRPPLVPFPAVWVGAVAGAALAFFLDPDRGKSRRAQARDRLAAGLRKSSQRAGRRARWSQGPIAGLGARLAGAFSSREPMNDATLAAKVETELFRDPDVPKGRININAENGTVILRGVAQSRDQIEHLLAQTASIDGVRVARSLLRTPDEPVETAIERHGESRAPVAGTAGQGSR
jgi:hypothetical protein